VPDNNQYSQTGSDKSADLQQQVEQAAADKTRLNIVGNNTKSFLGVINDAPVLDVSEHCGIVSYEPTELVITARAGTTLKEINTRLSEYDQTLAFEPPAFGSDATLGGTTGAMGTLGVLLDISVKVLPKVPRELTLSATTESEKAIEDMQSLAGLGLPITASAYIDGTVYTRLSGTDTSINAAASKLKDSGTIQSTLNASDKTELWTQLREHTHPFFQNQSSLWRISVPALTKPIDLNGNWLYDWAGMQRWLFTDAAANTVRSQCEAIGGHATLYRGSEELKRSAGVFHPLSIPLLKLQQRLKHEFDPHSIFNHQRLFPEF